MLVFGPAYLDIILDINRPLLDDPVLLLDQSLPATHTTAREDGLLLLKGERGDRLLFQLPMEGVGAAATYHLAESVLARLLGQQTTRTVQGEFSVSGYHTQVGGMGAGYALALDGLLRTPLGHDAVGRTVLEQLTAHNVIAAPSYLPDCASDTSMVVLSPRGDKLAVGVREAMVHWRANAEDRALVENASALVFCGAPNAVLAEVLSWRPDIPVMCAPAMRNVCDTTVPLTELAPQIHYLTLNALEWAHLQHKEQLLEQVPVISVTDGPRGSRIYLRGGRDYTVPVAPCRGTINTNRAGETYGSTFFKVLLREAADFVKTGRVTEEVAERAGLIASRQAARQLAIVGFAFPPDDWMA